MKEKKEKRNTQRIVLRVIRAGKLVFLYKQQCLELSKVLHLYGKRKHTHTIANARIQWQSETDRERERGHIQTNTNANTQ